MKTPMSAMPMTELPYEGRPLRWTAMTNTVLFVLLIVAAIAMNLVAAILTGFLVASFY